MTSTRNVREDDPGTRTSNPHLAVDLSEPLPRENRAQQEGSAVPDPHLDGEIAALDAVAPEKVPFDLDRPTGAPCPAAREEAGDDEAEPDDREGGRAKGP